ncbi:MAG: hypothetical protein WB677_24240, partial [Xanthobacteraceae bacterium]
MMARSPRSSKAGYIDARPPTQLDNVLLQRTAGPYIRVTAIDGTSPIAPMATELMRRNIRREGPTTDNAISR